MSMIRKQFFIDTEQNRRLQALAAETGKSESELVRESLSERLGRAGAETEGEGWRTALDKLSGAWAERDDMQEFVRDLRKGGSRRLRRLGLATSD